ncbi:MAG TPA: zinc-ribbon domain containing protein [Elusimicrobiota bacterium]|nr:zinc-ribbon domain containing protein [Elusimicrobiota bacterium]
MVCVQCEKEFVFEEGEQRFYESKGFQAPKRCPNCRHQQRRRFSFRRKQR